ncbi:MAG: hypothetical protein RLZZ628_3498 [Bacteroidota bacterium]|jgi:hypothetical protein
MKKVFYSLLLVVAVANAQAQKGDADLRQYFKAIGLDKQMERSVEREIEAVRETYLQDAIPATRLDSVANAIRQSYSLLENEMIALHKKEFTAKEIKTLTQFYESPVGQKKLRLEGALKEQTYQTELAWMEKMEENACMALTGMTLEEKRLLDLDNERFHRSLLEAQDSITMANIAIRLDTLLKHYQEKPSNVFLKTRLANQYNHFAWYQLMNGQYAKAEKNLQLGVQIDSTNLYLYTNLPLAALLQGNYEQAKAMYLAFKEKPYGLNGAALYKDVFLKDLRRFQTAGIIPTERLADVENIKALLSEGFVNSKAVKPPKN